MFEWNDSLLQSQPLASSPKLERLVEGLRILGGNVIDINASILAPLGMRGLPLIEWDLSSDAQTIIEFLRSQGSTEGYFISHPASLDREASGRFRRCTLGDNVAHAIAENNLFGFDQLFVDDRFTMVIAPWFSDLTFLCMLPGTFARYLAAHPMLLDLHGSDREVPSSNFQAALGASSRRLLDWSPAHQSMVESLRWQSIREV